MNVLRCGNGVFPSPLVLAGIFLKKFVGALLMIFFWVESVPLPLAPRAFYETFIFTSKSWKAMDGQLRSELFVE